MKRFLRWLAGRFSSRKATPRPAPKPAAPLRRSGSYPAPGRRTPSQAVPDRQPEVVDIEPHVGGRIESVGPGKNVLIRNRYVREDTGTHDTLKILDDSLIESEEKEGIDPYNTGQFDRSKQWDKRRK